MADEQFLKFIASIVPTIEVSYTELDCVLRGPETARVDWEQVDSTTSTNL